MVIRLSLAVPLGLGAALLLAPPAASAAVPREFGKCADLQAIYRHGVAKPGAHDVVRGHTKPVTTFLVDRKLYALNQSLDRDRDGVACEKR
jgi:hypothetical protein